jgi:hypothetical protein
MKPEIISALYKGISEKENIALIPIKFTTVGKGGACVEFDTLTKKPLRVCFDLKKCCDLENAIYHELAHIMLLFSDGYPGHGKKFQKVYNNLVDKYMYSKMTTLIILDGKKSGLTQLLK